MKLLKPKLALIVIGIISLMFFSNNFGLIDIEKTAIITAIAIDYENGEYEVTAQIAVPQASNTTTENQKTQISAKGSTIANAIKNTSTETGWYPQLIFCNLIVLGESMQTKNVITVLDYFSKTYRVQDSAQIVLFNGKGSELLKTATPLDNISSFAIQKILLKNPGFDKNVCSIDVKEFCTGYYSKTKASFMPIITTEQKQDDGDGSSKQQEQTSGQEGSSKQQSHTVFNATSTALFLNGKKAGELPEELTHVFNILTTNVNGSTLAVNNVTNENGKSTNYLLTIMRSAPKTTLTVNENDFTVNVCLNLYCKISDQNSESNKSSLSQNTPLSKELKTKTQQNLKNSIENLFETQKQTGCDILKIKEMLYKFHYKHYHRYKDNYLNAMRLNINVNVNGQL